MILERRATGEIYEPLTEDGKSPQPWHLAATGQGAVQFALDKPLPTALIKRVPDRARPLSLRTTRSW